MTHIIEWKAQITSSPIEASSTRDVTYCLSW